MSRDDHGFTRTVRNRIALLAALLLLGVWADSRAPVQEAAPPVEIQPHRDPETVIPRNAHDGQSTHAQTLGTGLSRDEVMLALDDGLFWEEVPGEDQTWIGTGEWTVVILSGDPMDLSGVHLYHKTPEYAVGLTEDEEARLHAAWRQQSLVRAQGFIHRLLPQWSFHDLQNWSSQAVASFAGEVCDPYCMDFTLFLDNIVVLTEFPDETLSVGLFSLGDFLYALEEDDLEPRPAARPQP